MNVRYDEKGKYFTKMISKEAVEVIVQTSTHRIQGNFYIRPEERIKDALNRSDPFLALTDAVVYDSQDQVLYRTEFLSLNQQHIQWLIPLDDLQTNDHKQEGD